MKILLEMEKQHYDIVIKALEMYSRVKIGQFNIVAENLQHLDTPTYLKIMDTCNEMKKIYPKTSMLQNECKDAQVAWEIRQCMLHDVSWFINPCGGHTVNYNEVLHQSGIPLVNVKITE